MMLLKMPSKLILLSVFFIIEIQSFAQNEAYHGGTGDGFGYQGSSPVNMSQVAFIGGDLTVSINLGNGQNNITDQEPVVFSVNFNQDVIDFDSSDIEISGEALPGQITVSGSGSEYLVQLSNFTSNGEISINLIQGKVHNSVGNSNNTSTIIDNTVTFTGLRIGTTIDLQTNQQLLTNSDTVHFKIDFTEDVVDFSPDDVVLSGTAIPSQVNITGSGKIFDVAVSGMTESGTVEINISANTVHNVFGTPNAEPVIINNSVTCDYIAPSCEINLSPGQDNPSLATELQFTISFSETIQSLNPSDIQLSGTAGATNISVSQQLNIYTLSVTGMTHEGTVIVSLPSGLVFDLAGNGNLASVNTANEIIFQNLPLTLEINLAPGQNDITDHEPVLLSVNFNQDVVDFDVTDLEVTGTALAEQIAVSGSGNHYLVQLSSFTSNGEITINLPQDKVHTSFGNSNIETTIIDNSVIFNGLSFETTIDLAINQQQLTNSGTVHFKVEFSDDVVDFSPDDVVLSGTANPTLANITGTGKNYDVAVSGMSGSGTVEINIPENTVHNDLGVLNSESVNINNSVICDYIAPSCEINLSPGQDNPSLATELQFTISFSETIQSLNPSDIQLSGTAGATNISVSQQLNIYTLSVTGMAHEGTVIVSLPSGLVFDLAGNGNLASVNTANEIYYQNSPFTVEINLAPGQNPLIQGGDAFFKVHFNRAPVDFDLSDLTIEGTSNYSFSEIEGSGTDFTLHLSGIALPGNITVTLEANKVKDENNYYNQASINSSNEIIVDTDAPFATIDFGPVQNNPSNGPDLVFRITFNEDVEDFLAEDIQVQSTAGSCSPSLVGSGKSYVVTVSGMDHDGDVSINVPINICKDLAGNFNSASLIINNSIHFDNSTPSVEITQDAGQLDPAETLPLKFHVEFSEDVFEFGSDKINYGGSSSILLDVSGSGKSYTVSATGVNINETLMIDIAPNVVHDLAGNHNLASINTDNSITYKGLTSVERTDYDKNCKIYAYAGKVYVNFIVQPLENTLIKITDLQGRIIFEKQNPGLKNEFALPPVKSPYIISVNDGKTQLSKKLMP
ncbi:MAG: hypothetical protein U0W24_15045 [Bacteroidales bacterium]